MGSDKQLMLPLYFAKLKGDRLVAFFIRGLSLIVLSQALPGRRVVKLPGWLLNDLLAHL
jgi:hypothetical protein